jgi:hypothetical protein
VKAVQIEFDRTLERARDLLVERPVRDSLTETEIKRIAEFHYAEMLHFDEEETREGTGRDALMKSIASQLDAAGVEYTTGVPFSENPPMHGLSDADVLRRLADWEFETPILKAALATGDISEVEETLDYLLAVFGINLDRHSEAYRRLGMAVLRKRVVTQEVTKRRTEGEPIETPPLPAVGINSTPGVKR